MQKMKQNPTKMKGLSPKSGPPMPRGKGSMPPGMPMKGRMKAKG